MGLVVDIEGPLRSDGQRPNKQVRVVGDAVLTPDTAATWTRQIRAKYIDDQIARDPLVHSNIRDRTLITITPHHINAAASV